MAELPAGGGSSNSPEEQESGSNGNSTEGTNRILVGRSRAGADDDMTAFIQAQLEQQQEAATDDGVTEDQRSAFFVRALSASQRMRGETARLDAKRSQLYTEMGITAAQMADLTAEHAAEQRELEAASAADAQPQTEGEHAN